MSQPAHRSLCFTYWKTTSTDYYAHTVLAQDEIQLLLLVPVVLYSAIQNYAYKYVYLLYHHWAYLCTTSTSSFFARSIGGMHRTVEHAAYPMQRRILRSTVIDPMRKTYA